MTVWVPRSCRWPRRATDDRRCRAPRNNRQLQPMPKCRVFSWSRRGAGRTVSKAPYHPGTSTISSILWCSLTPDRKHVHPCFKTNKLMILCLCVCVSLLCWSFLQRWSKRSRIHLSLIWLIKAALPLIIFYLFPASCTMESVREGGGVERFCPW